MDRSPFSFRALLEAQAAREGARPFFTFGGHTWTAAEMDAGANRLANVLRDAGIGRRDHVAVLLPNGPEIVWCWWGLAKLGAVYVPVNTQLVGESLAHVLTHSEAVALVTTDPLLAQARAALPAWPAALRHVLSGAGLSGRVAAASPAPPPAVDERPEDPALIIYTSGTTGAPKGVLWSRRAQTHHARRYAAELNCAEPGESVYTCLPFFHVTSIGVSISSYLRGARVAVDSAFDPFSHWQRIREERAVLFPYVGAILSLLHKRPPRPDDADNPVRWAMGAAAPKEIWEPVERRFGLRLVETYGQTEFAGHWLMRPLADRTVGGKPGTVGKPPARLAVKLVDEQGREIIAPDVPGELAVRAASAHLLMEGYYKQPDASARAFRDGWYSTGDRLSRDADGYFTYHGRLKDFIRHRGENVSAFEVELTVSQHPAVLECAAVGLPSDLGEEDVLLCVVPRDTAAQDAQDTQNTRDPEALYAWCRRRLAPFMLPRYILYLEALPKTATQRVRKFLLAERGAAGAWDRQHPWPGQRRR